MLGSFLCAALALSSSAADDGVLQPAHASKKVEGHPDIKGLPAQEGKTRKVVTKSAAHEARDARMGLNVAPGEPPPRVWASPQLGSAVAPGASPEPPAELAPSTERAPPGQWRDATDGPPGAWNGDGEQGKWNGPVCVGVTCVGNSSADDAKDLAILCPGHPALLRSSPDCESKSVSSTWVVGGGDTHNEMSNMDPRTMWITRGSKNNVPGCSTFLTRQCGIENCVTSNGHGACVKPKPGTCAAACKDIYGRQGTYIKGLEPFVDAQCGFTFNATYREENITSYGERGGTRWEAIPGGGPPSNISQCACFTGRHIEEDLKNNQINGSHRREYVALCEDFGYTAAPGREHPFEKRDVRRDGEKTPNFGNGEKTPNVGKGEKMSNFGNGEKTPTFEAEKHSFEAKNGTPGQTNMPSQGDGVSTGAPLCFPSASTVTLADGITQLRMDELRHGDAVRAVTRDGKLTTDTVSFLSLADTAAVATFVRITTEGGTVVTLTPEHRLPVGEACCGTLNQAKGVERGDTIWVAAGGGGVAPAPQRIATTARVEAKGLHSPVLTHGTFPLIEEACASNPLADVALTGQNFEAMEALAMADDAACSRAGVVTAFDSLGFVDLASYGVPLLEPVCKALGVCASVRRALLGSGGSYVQIK